MSLSSPLSLEEKRKEALTIAKRCMKVLRKDFSAKEVILFGSLRGDAPWHEKSDLDLAVEGLSEEAWWEAYQAIKKMMPEWLTFDLVPLEKAPPHLQNYILQNYPMADHPYLVLKARLATEIVALEETVQTLSSLLQQSSQIPDIALIPALASYITDFYTICERLSERVAVSLDDGLPQGDNLHQQLLHQVAERRINGRPPLWNSVLLA